MDSPSFALKYSLLFIVSGGGEKNNKHDIARNLITIITIIPDRNYFSISEFYCAAAPGPVLFTIIVPSHDRRNKFYKHGYYRKPYRSLRCKLHKIAAHLIRLGPLIFRCVSGFVGTGSDLHALGCTQDEKCIAMNRSLSVTENDPVLSLSLLVLTIFV